MLSTKQRVENEMGGNSRDNDEQGMAATLASTTELRNQGSVKSLTGTEERLKSPGHLEEKNRYMNRDKSLPAIPSDALEEPISNPRSHGDDNFDFRESLEKPRSVQSTRPLIRNSEDGFGYKPEIKLGPRPSLDYSGRPNRKNSHSQGESRLVSTLPAGVRMPARKAVPPRQQSQQNQSKHHHSENTRDSPKATITTVMPSPVVNRPSSRSGSIRSLSTLSHTPETKPTATALEKQRLMKALQIRQRQMAKRVVEEDPSPQSTKSSTSHHNPAKAMDDEVVLRVLDEVSPVEGESDILHVGMKDFSDISSVNPQSSPISILEPSEGPSTQASSIADVEESDLCEISTQGQISANSELLPHPTGGEIEHALLITNDADVGHELTAKDDQALRSFQHEKAHLIPYDIPLPESTEDEDTLLGLSPDLIEVAEDEETTLVSSRNLVAVPENDASRTVVVPVFPPYTIRESNESKITVESTPSHNHIAMSSNSTNRNVKRRGLVNPIQIGSNLDNLDDNFLSDDSFMEELQSAPVEEAMPISVSRSPITPVFPRSPKSLAESPPSEGRKLLQESTNSPNKNRSQYLLVTHVQDTVKGDSFADVEPSLPKASRSVSNPLDSLNLQTERHLSPRSSKDIARRSVSISPNPMGRAEISLPLSKKIGVSTGISQRIKALEKFTSSPTTQASLTPLAVSPTLINNRKTSIENQRATSDLSENSAARNFSFRRKFPYPTPSPSPQATRLAQNSESPTPGHHDGPAKSQPMSISVTARIVRDVPNQKPDVPMDLSEPSVAKLHHSPLIVEHEAPTQITKKSPARPTKSRPNSYISNSSSSPEAKRETLVDSRRNSSSSRRPGPSRKGSDADTSNALSESSYNSQESTEGKEEKKTSKRSRLFKRMSSMSSSSRRSIVHALSSSVKEEDTIPEHQHIKSTTPLLTLDLGDLNIQFPDTLVSMPRVCLR